MEKENKDSDDVKIEKRKIVATALKKCRGKTKKEVLSGAEKLTSEERLAIIDHFKIEPQDLAGIVIHFWLELGKSAMDAEVLLGEAFFTE